MPEAGKGDFHEVRLRALKEVGPSVFFSLLVIAVAFLPVFTLVDQEGRLFKPLAYTKNLVMAIAAILAITLDPALRMMFTRMDYHTFRPRWLSGLWNAVAVGRYYPEEQHPISKRLFRIYEPACNFVLRHKALTLIVALLLVLTTIPVYFQLGSEFMPPLYEGIAALHAHDRAGHLGGGSPATPANDGQAVARSSPRWSGCSARQAGRRPRPIPRRSR